MAPDSDAMLPAIAYYMASDTPTVFADDRAYQSTMEYVVDVWGESGQDIKPIAIQVMQKMGDIGFEWLQSKYVHDKDAGAMYQHMQFVFNY